MCRGTVTYSTVKKQFECGKKRFALKAILIKNTLYNVIFHRIKLLEIMRYPMKRGVMIQNLYYASKTS